MKGANAIRVAKVHLDLDVSHKFLNHENVAEPAGDMQRGHTIAIRKVGICVVAKKHGNDFAVGLGSCKK